MKEKQGELPMTPCLDALLGWLNFARPGFRLATAVRNSPFGEFIPSPIGRSWLSNTHG
jgi:hypothetical protein